MALFAAPLDPSGDLDGAFSGDGKQSVNYASVLSFAEARSVARQSTGKLVLGGSSVTGGSISHYALIRLHANGTQDMTWGVGGATNTVMAGNDLINDIAAQADDKIVAVGYSRQGSRPVEQA